MPTTPGFLRRTTSLISIVLGLDRSHAATGPRHLLRQELGVVEADSLVVHRNSRHLSSVLVADSGSVLRASPAACRNDDDCHEREFCNSNHTGYQFCLPCNECNQHNASHGDCSHCLSGHCTAHTQCALGTWCNIERACRLCNSCNTSLSINGECDEACAGICSSHSECAPGQFCGQSQRCHLCSECDVSSTPISGGCSICSGSHYGCDTHTQCSTGEFCSDHVCWTCAECSDHMESGCSAKCDGHCAKHDECVSGHFCNVNGTCSLCSHCQDTPTNSLDGTCDICHGGL